MLPLDRTSVFSGNHATFARIAGLSNLRQK